jgi:hypothetical protein
MRILELRFLWFIFIPKKSISVYFGGPWNEKTLVYIMTIIILFKIFYSHLVYFMAVWYSLGSFGTFTCFGIFGQRKIWQP